MGELFLNSIVTHITLVPWSEEKKIAMAHLHKSHSHKNNETLMLAGLSVSCNTTFELHVDEATKSSLSTASTCIMLMNGEPCQIT